MVIGYWTIIVVVIAVAIVLVILLKKRTNKKNNSKSKPMDQTIELDKSTKSTIHFSDEFKSIAPVEIKENGHRVTSLYMSKESPFIWTCLACETENTSSRERCIVCHNAK